MLKKLLLISCVCLNVSYLSASATAAASGGGTQTTTVAEDLMQSSSGLTQISKRVYPNLSADNYQDIFTAAGAGDAKAVEEYIEKRKINPKASDAERTTVLHFAALSGNLDLVLYLLKKGADKRALSQDGETVLHFAALGGNLAVVRYLILIGLDPRVVDAWGGSVLENAARSGSLAVVRYLLEEFPGRISLKPNILSEYRVTVLQLAVGSGSFDLVKYLVEHHQADPGTTDAIGHNALHPAQKYKYYHILAYFADRGFELSVWSKPQVKLIRQRVLEALEGRQFRRNMDQGSTLNKKDKEKNVFAILRKSAEFIEPFGVSAENIKNKRFIFPAEIDSWNDVSDRERSLIKARIKGVQSEEYLFHVLEKIRLEGLERLKREKGIKE